MIYKTESIHIFIGIDEEKEIRVLPYIFNKTRDKIKILCDNTIFKTQVDYSLFSIISKFYNIKMYDDFDLSSLVKSETITSQELEDLTYSIHTIYAQETKLKNNSEEEYKNLLQIQNITSYKTTDLFWFIGLQNDDNNEVAVVPFIFNKNHTKIKVITDDKIYNINKDNLALSLNSDLEKNYNAKLYTFYTLNEITKKESLNIKEIEDYKYAFEIYFKNKIKARDGNEFTFFKNDRYQDF